jgi:hypothetical protein
MWSDDLAILVYVLCLVAVQSGLFLADFVHRFYVGRCGAVSAEDQSRVALITWPNPRQSSLPKLAQYIDVNRFISRKIRDQPELLSIYPYIYPSFNTLVSFSVA